jgi:post-segregation antitoxin (ccd killing protein)
MGKTTIVLPDDVHDAARRNGVNMSFTAKRAIERAVMIAEQETGAKIRQDPTPDTPSNEAV